MDYTVCINNKCHFNLWNTAGCRRDTHQLKHPKHFIVSSHLPFTLTDLYCNSRLVVCGSREYLALTCRNGAVSFYQLCKDPAQCLNTEGKRRHIKEEDILNLPFQYPTLDCSTYSNYLIRVHALVRFFFKEVPHHFLSLRHPCLSAYQHNLIYLFCCNSGILHRLAARCHRSVNEIIGKLFQLCP